MITHAMTTTAMSGVRSTIARALDVLGQFPLPLLSPDLAATLAATFEIGCAALLILGLATRLATLPFLGMIVVIQTFVYPNAYAEHLTWASILLFLLTRGGGPWSLDKALGLEPGVVR